MNDENAVSGLLTIDLHIDATVRNINRKGQNDNY